MGQTNKLHNINWDALDHASHVPPVNVMQLVLCVYVCAFVFTYMWHAVHVVVVCGGNWYQNLSSKDCQVHEYLVGMAIIEFFFLSQSNTAYIL